jgi:signal recognition particle receptor subunit beta
MPTINYSFKEIVCKIVYYGPGLGGKTTNLQFVHTNVPQRHRGELVSLATEQDRTLFFDYLPLDIGDVKGFKTKFQLYTVPGQVFYNQTRKLVLRGVDGIAFIADSQRSRHKENVNSLENLRENLSEYGLELESIPFVMQYNKRDMPDAMPIDELRKDLNPNMQWPDFEAIAPDGSGVRETLRELCSQVLKKLNATANIVSDEQEVGERLGLIPDSESSTIESPIPMDSAAKNAPPLEITQDSRVLWNGIGLGSGTISLTTIKNDKGFNEYSLSSNHKVLGLKRSLLRSLKYVGEDRRQVNGIETVYHVLRDTSGSREASPITAFVEKQGYPKLYLIYAGLGGDMKIGPKGEIFAV